MNGTFELQFLVNDNKVRIKLVPYTNFFAGSSLYFQGKLTNYILD